MELIWKNETGSILGTKSYNPDTTDVHEALAETDWIFTPGDTIEICKTTIRKKDIATYLTDKINETFEHFQEVYSISNGDIDPLDSYTLDEKIKDIAELIAKVLRYERGDDEE
jgi:hypothetical protein